MKNFMSMRKKDKIMQVMNNLVVDLPSPSSINYLWNFGSLLGLCLVTQTLTGIFLAMHYVSDISLAFESVVHITRDVNNGWSLRFIHTNGASLFFICIYMHMFRGMYYNSFMKLFSTWMVGVTILILTMTTAFMGYVLPWGQMSFWGATVITNLLSAVPYLGTELVNWIWGGFSVSNPTLNRFFVFHFILPFILMAFSVIHLIFLHEKGSSNPLGIKGEMDKIPFHPYYTWKDLISLILALMILIFISFTMPFFLGDPENFIQSNPLVTPIHIQPEWYFLFAYAILRSIPNKLGGVLAFVMSIMMFYFLPFLSSNHNIQSNLFMKINKFSFFMFISVMILLTWIGARPVEDPFIMIGQILTLVYFLFFLSKPMMN